MTTEDKFYALIEKDQFGRARQLVRTALKDDPTHHGLWYFLAFVEHASQSFGRALAATRRGLKICPTCPMLFALQSEHLAAMGRTNEAIDVCRAIIRRGVRNIARDPCMDGLGWAKALVNDRRFHLALLYNKLGKRKPARYNYRRYMQDRDGRTSDWPISIVREVGKEIGTRR